MTRRVTLCAGTIAAILITGAAAPAATVNAGSLSQFDAVAEIDVAGSFTYAINYTDTGVESSNYTVGDATFQPGSESFSGASDTFDRSVNDWDTRPDFGSDDILEQAIWDIEWRKSGSPPTADLDLTVTAGTPYKLQLMFKENRNASKERIMNINLEGTRVVSDMDIVAEGQDSGETPPNNGLVYSRTFTAGDSTLDVGLVNSTDSEISGPLLNAMTLEVIPEPASFALLAPAGLMLLRRRR